MSRAQGRPKRSRASGPGVVVRLERAMESALRPGVFINYRASWSFVRDLEEVADELRALVRGGRAGDAAELFETFIAACHEKAGEIDDSSGSFGDLVADLFCDWVRARKAAKCEPEETVELVLAWMDEDEHGFCFELENRLVEALDAKGRRAFAAAVRARLEASPPDDRGSRGYPRRRWGAALKTVLAALGDAEGFRALCEQEGLGSDECLVLARLHARARRKDWPGAMKWVERGLTLAKKERFSHAEHDLKELQRELLVRLGRRSEAVEAAWADFESHPHALTCETLLALAPEAERADWRERALSVAEQADLPSAISVLREQGEIERLAARIDRAPDAELESLSHHEAEPLAELLAKTHLLLAARLHRALGMRIVDAGKSKYYSQALGHLERARDASCEAGDAAAWEEVVADVRARHHRKHGFMEGFDRIAAGGPAKQPGPSFLERAKKRRPKRR